MGVVGFFFFFFQAEDGIRDLTVTGVQTCALPISPLYEEALVVGALETDDLRMQRYNLPLLADERLELVRRELDRIIAERSEERRVGKECRSRWWPKH